MGCAVPMARVSFRVVVLAGVVSVGACAATSEVNEPQTGKLIGRFAKRWPKPAIPVCFRNPSWTHEGRPVDHGEPLPEDVVVAALRHNFNDRTNVTLTGFGPCRDSEPGIQIIWNNEARPGTWLGPASDSAPTFVYLAFDFSKQPRKDWLTDHCPTSRHTENSCIEVSALHEFMHVVALSLHKNKHPESTCDVEPRIGAEHIVDAANYREVSSGSSNMIRGGESAIDDIAGPVRDAVQIRGEPFDERSLMNTCFYQNIVRKKALHHERQHIFSLSEGDVRHVNWVYADAAPSSCGNERCEVGETSDTCPRDCVWAPRPSIERGSWPVDEPFSPLSLVQHESRDLPKNCEEDVRDLGPIAQAIGDVAGEMPRCMPIGEPQKIRIDSTLGADHYLHVNVACQLSEKTVSPENFSNQMSAKGYNGFVLNDSIVYGAKTTQPCSDDPR